jgi:hypothetical protein
LKSKQASQTKKHKASQTVAKLGKERKKKLRLEEKTATKAEDKMQCLVCGKNIHGGPGDNGVCESRCVS